MRESLTLAAPSRARWRCAAGLVILGLLLSGCISPKVKLFSDGREPLEEHTLQGSAEPKILVVNIRGLISDAPRESLLRSRPSMVQEVLSQLKKAEQDKTVKALVLKLDSPGGVVTASDVLYHQVVRFKQRTGARVVAAMLDVAASGAYYVALAADCIVAHPTTVTGSVGVIFLQPKVGGLMKKIGLAFEVSKSGANKDMGSPFRASSAEERQIIQQLINELAARFLGLVARHRPMDRQAMEGIATGRVYSAREALQIGLVDQIGYLDDAIVKAKQLAGLPGDAKVIVYRRAEYPDDTLYNTSTARSGAAPLRLVDLGMADFMTSLPVGFYYLWLPAMDMQ